MPNLGGVFILMLGGMIASVILGFGEFMWENRLLAFTPGVISKADFILYYLVKGERDCRLRKFQKSLWSDMWRDLKFALDPRQGDSKPVVKESEGGGSKPVSSGPLSEGAERRC